MVCTTHRRREADSNFQFLGLGRAFLYRLGVTAPFLASSRNASGTAFVASNRGRPRRRVTLTPRLMTSSCRSALRRSGCELWKRRTTEAVWWMRCQTTTLKDLLGKIGDTRCSFPRLWLTPESTSCPSPPRVHLNEVNSKRAYDTLSALVTSPTQRKRFDRAGDCAAHRIPVTIRPLLLPRSSVD